MSLPNYQPQQPGAPADGKSVSYQELSPDIALAEFVYCYWRLRTQTPLLEPYVYGVVTDGCIDVFFDWTQPESCFLMGFQDRFAEFELGQEFDFFGIRLLPTAVPRLFGCSAADLTNRVLPLAEVNADLAAFLIASVNPETEEPAFVMALDSYLKDLKPVDSLDPRILMALRAVLLQGGNLKIAADLDVPVSPRQLRRLFHRYVGATPKAFSKVIRFQNALRTEAAGERGAYFDLGYFDQAHFIKEFRRHGGKTPGSGGKGK